MTLRVPEARYELLLGYRDTLEDLVIVSGLEVERGSGETIEVEVHRAEGEKCERCWHYRATVGADASLPTVCADCAEEVKSGWPELVTA